MKLLTPFFILAALALLSLSVQAADPGEPFEDPALEQRYHRIVNELRCLVCQNESIAESNAELAQDLRAQVRTMLADGATDQEIKNYMTERYGDFVLYRPPMRADTLALWFGPAFLLLIGAVVLVVTLVRRARQDAEEEAELEGREQ
ncbi:cytochrome c-type biogenesis protein [Gammaproteobacteria bacterium AB-CW1]|uniref:Cytochrome c-type biogenesis protein n=1 Tax=Natronospira elongata TaxID=3110268 RepID=A0AAP6JHX9_9GAMM|nr:cytochrome c-type biogenesis protein [Gammaproteobacteria bacterium AB-CW1]